MPRLFLVALLLSPLSTFAYEVVSVEQPSPFEISTIDQVSEEQLFVGTLSEFPHTFEFTVTEPTRLQVQALVPVGTAGEQRMSLIAIKEVERGVKEVMRRTNNAVEWGPYEDDVSGLAFEASPAFDEEIEPGVYRVEVSNAQNLGTYVLKLGYENTAGGYFLTVKNIYALRTLLGYGGVGIVFNMYVAIPLFFMFSVGFFLWWWRRHTKLTSETTLT